MTGLESKIFNFIETQYSVEFKGTVSVTISNGEYCLSLTLNNYMIPMVLCGQYDNDEKFYSFITKQIAERNLVKVDYLTLKKHYEEYRET